MNVLKPVANVSSSSYQILSKFEIKFFFPSRLQHFQFYKNILSVNEILSFPLHADDFFFSNIVVSLKPINISTQFLLYYSEAYTEIKKHTMLAFLSIKKAKIYLNVLKTKTKFVHVTNFKVSQ